jgi:hypothetical protein
VSLLTPPARRTRRDVVDLDSMERTSMACPAMPLCGLAVTEAERSLPDMLPRLRALLNGMGLEDLDSLVVRMTGAHRAGPGPAPFPALRPARAAERLRPRTP